MSPGSATGRTSTRERGLLVCADRIHVSFAPQPPPGHGAPPDAFVVQHGRVVEVGRAATLRSRYPGAEVLEFQGGTITPGLIDAHIHLVEWAETLERIDLTSLTTPEEAAEAVARRAGSAGVQGDWITGHGWSRSRWSRSPDRAILDRWVPDRPVALYSQDLHALWVNTRALQAAGITDDTPDPQGGVIVRDATGRATGMLLEAAAALVIERMPATPDGDIARAVRRAQSVLHGFGITAVHGLPGVHRREPADLRVLQSLVEAGELRLRVLQHLPVWQLETAIALGLRSGLGGDWLRIGGVKLFLDGALGSQTAWLREPYEGTADYGISNYTADAFRAIAHRAARAGLAMTVHAIGDAAVAQALDTLADPALPAVALPHRIEHVQLCPPNYFGVGARAGIIHSVQPAHLITDWRAADELWGRERCERAYAFASLLDAGATLAFGSDGPVADPDPRLGLFAATARQDLSGAPAHGWYPEQRISTRAALWAYTGGPAIAAGLRGQQGELVPGAFADFVVWERDPLLASGADFLALECRATAVGGQVVWSSSDRNRQP